MSLPWNRGDPEGSSDSWLDLLPIVHRVDHTDSERVPERSEPSMVAPPDDREVDVTGRPDGPRSASTSRSRSTVDDIHRNDTSESSVRGESDDPGEPNGPETEADDPTVLLEQ